MMQRHNDKKHNRPEGMMRDVKRQAAKLVKRAAVLGVGLSMVAQTLMPTTNAMAAVIQRDAEYNQIRRQLIEANSAEVQSGDVVEGDSSQPSAGDGQTDGAETPDAGSASDAGGDAGQVSLGDTDGNDASENADPGLLEDPEADGGDSADDASSQSVDSETAAQNASYEINSIDDLKEALNKSDANITIVDGSITELKQATEGDFILLSNSDPKLYSKAAISISGTGDFNLKGTANYNGLSLSYQGLGSKETPFEGAFDARTFILKRALFAGYKPSSDVSISVKFERSEQDSNGNLLADYIYGNSKSIFVALQFAGSGTTSPAVVMAPIFGELDSSLTLNATYSIAASGTSGGGVFSKSVDISSDANAGLVARTVAPDATLKLKSLSGFKPSAANVASNNASAGLLVGELASNATFDTCALGLSLTGTITATGNAAGGLVGKTNEGATVKVSDDVDLTNLTIAGKASGGFIGSATKLSLNDDSFSGKLTLPKTVGDKDVTTVAGGFIGDASFNADYTFPSDANKVAFPNDGIALNGKEVVDNGKGEGCGAVFGKLKLRSNVTIENRDDIKSSSAGGKANYGGVTGFVYLGDVSAAHSLTISSSTVTSTGGTDNTWYYGGLVGWIGDSAKNTTSPRAALVVRNAKVVTNNPSAGRTFGGAVACVDTATIDLGSFALNTGDNSITISGSDGTHGRMGGTAGELWAGSVLRFVGTTDLSNAKFAANDRMGQLVGLAVKSLIYADGTGTNASDVNVGWTFERPGAVEIDDIATSGEVIRLGSEELKGLITIDANNNAQAGDGSITGASYDIANLKDFARLAIAWQTRNMFNTAPENLNVNLKTNIDLSGTGLSGLTLDNNSDSYDATSAMVYSGTISGDDGQKTITLAIGEPYGKRNGKELASSDTTEGNGKIYRHDRLGLLASASGSTSNIAINGSINFKAKKDIYVGPLAANLTTFETTLSNVSSSVQIKCDSDDNRFVSLGGLYGYLNGKTDGKQILSFNSSNAVNANISVNSNAQRVTSGGAIGTIDADCPAQITVGANGLNISGSMTFSNNSSADSVPAGGFIGVINPSTAVGKKSVELNGLTLDGLKIEYKKAAAMAGGLLGFLWGDTEVTFKNGGLKTSNSVTDGGTGNAKVANFGGLVYCASGKWTINDGGIDLTNVVINNVSGVLGLLVCQGGQAQTTVVGNQKTTYGLYLETRHAWDTAYRVSENICGTGINASQFDEWVASTVDICTGDGHENNILAAGENGVVSLRTANGIVAMDGSTCNTYQNRTTYGESHRTNVNTRYYYNLDKIQGDLKNSTVNSKIDTPAELMLWSAIRYAQSTLTGYLEVADTDCSGAINDISGTLDMRDYSYYPVDINRVSISVSDAHITFHNEEIEKAENSANNKLTSAQSQHMTMHAGLFRNYMNKTSDVQDQTNLKVANSSFAGTIGMMASGGNGSYTPLAYSGALICGEITGSVSRTGSRNMMNVEIDGCTLKGVTVYNFEQNNRGYAPALINIADSYVSLSVKNVTSGLNSYQNGKKAGTSLIGDFGKTENGATSSTQLTISFEQIGFSGKGSAIFTKATLLNKFTYADGGIASGSYNFYREDDKKTFGQEIDRQNTEYSGKQLWFYNEDTYKTEEGYAKDGDVTADPKAAAFKDYLPYVYVTSDTNNGAVFNHEIKVNQRFENLVLGCGTYGDPYVISSESKLQTLADYISHPDNAKDGWQITIAKDQNALCKRRSSSPSNDNEVTYTYYESGEWRSGASSVVLTNDAMHRYIQSCYIDINVDGINGKAGELVLGSGFSGIGDLNNPFRGVITSTNNTRLVIDRTNAGAFNGLVQYSCGCVVSNLNITYKGVSSLGGNTKDETHKAPGTFFGGVIGSVLGGDNIIENVSITSDSFSVLASSNLVPIGGYVGVISGGGVLFRGAESKWYSGGNDQLYNNPVVGRVLDGYAFSENANGLSDNTVSGKACNYKVNNLNAGDTGIITTDKLETVNSADKKATTTMVKDAQGLLLLSAIINSGAASGATNSKDHYTVEKSDYGSKAGSNAYYGLAETNSSDYSFGNGNYGKVRNASYAHVGNPDVTGASEDFAKSVNDDTLTPGSSDGTYATDITDFSKVNAPYLVSHYATDAKTMFICGAGICSMDLEFGEGEFDLTGYGTGYLGISGRFYTNAALNSTDSSDYYARDRVTPHIAKINGNNKALKVNLDVHEYSNDDFYTLGVGALGSYLLFTQTNIDSTLGEDGYYIQDLTISGSTIKHARNGNGSNANPPSYVGAGGVAGIAAGDATLDKNAIKLSNVHIGADSDDGKVEVTSPNATLSTAGSFFGNSGTYGSASVKVGGTGGAGSIDMLRTTSTNKALALEFYDCSFTNTKVTGGDFAGGFVGSVNRNSDSDKTASSLTNRITLTGPHAFVLGKDSSVSTRFVTENGQWIDSYLGGLIGYLNQKIEISGFGANAKMSMIDVSATTDEYVEAAGGLVGRMDTGAVSSIISHLSIDSTKDSSNYPKIGTTKTTQMKGNNFNKGIDKAGGLVGTVDFSSSGSKVTVDDCNISKIHLISREADGGCFGFIQKGTIEASNIVVADSIIDGSYSGGFLGSILNSSSKGDVVFRLQNAQFVRNAIGKDGYNAYWRAALGSLSGGVFGDARGDISMSNILINSCTFLDKKNGYYRQGIVCGSAHKDAMNQIRIAGLEVRLPEGALAANYPDRLVLAGESAEDNGTPKDFDEAVAQTFISFANYDNDAKSADGKVLVNGVEQSMPYVTTSPVSDAVVKATDDGDDQYLFGDGSNVDVAGTIVSEKGSTDLNRFTYKNVGGQKDGKYSSETSFVANNSTVSTFNDNNPTGKQVAKNFKVLQISGEGGADTIESYINVITNGGFADAKKFNSGNIVYVTASSAVYKRNDNGALVKTTDTPNVIVTGARTKNIGFNVSSSYDNGEGKFTLITVTFSAAGNADGDNPTMSHTVVVPVIVRRQLENTFTATLDYGTNFTETPYLNRGANVRLLQSFGASSTGLLTFSYNKALDEATQTYTKNTEYGWDSYLAAGGSMGAVNKTLYFDSNGKNLPVGTQLILIDKDNGDHAYKLTLKSEASNISLSEFEDTEDSNKHYSPKWMSELMGVTVDGSEDKSGAWVPVNSPKDATVKAKDGTYYRPARSGDTDKRYNLKCEKGSGGKELTPSENFYLVILIPQGTSVSDGGINGSLKASVECDGVKMGETKATLRTDNKEDSHSSTASTYNFVASYDQVLTDEALNNKREDYKEKIPDNPTSGAGKVLHMDAVDKVTAGKSQLFTSADKLYYKLDASLTKVEGETSSSFSFPTGTSGTVSFYVYTVGEDQSKTYWLTGAESDPGSSNPVAMETKDWTSDGTTMSLTLDSDLAQIRAKGTFYVEARMDIHLSPEAYNAAIAASQSKGKDAYTRLNYRASLADSISSLKSSTEVTTANGEVYYYREDTGVATISFTAEHTDQLGINLNDLTSKGNGTIDPITAIYDMNSLSNSDDVIAKGKRIAYTLTLEKRSSTNGEYAPVSSDISKYVTVTSAELGNATDGSNDSFVWTDTAGASGFRTKDGNSNRFKLTIHAKVDTALDAHEYANYRLRITAQMYDADGNPVAGTTPWNENMINQEDAGAHSDYITYTLTRVKLDGLQVKQSG